MRPKWITPKGGAAFLPCQIFIYQTESGKTKIEVRLENETVWLNQVQMAELFDKGRSTISEHIQNIFEEGELEEGTTCRKFRQVLDDGRNYEVLHYNLDVIISVGYRVKK
ncbi:MAG: cell filamentation protein Fic [Bacteriovoracaceae bacterium]|nr:cell filamentation protein Fic [Bacteriovoracaceae bacterium]